jgi:electron transfer flavoprotein alpha/beta subunit
MRRWTIALEDEAAVEAALETADTVVAVGIGGEPARGAARAALRMGASDAVHVEYEPIEPAASEKFARVLAEIAHREAVTSVFVGDAVGEMGVELPSLLGERVSWPAVTRVTALGDDVAVDVETAGVPVQRTAGVGEQSVLAVTPPVVLGVDPGYGNPRRGTLDDAIDAGQTELRTISLDEVVPGESRFSMHLGAATVGSVTANDRWGRGNPPSGHRADERIVEMLGRSDGSSRSGGGERVHGSPDEAAERVVEYLEANGLL